MFISLLDINNFKVMETKGLNNISITFMWGGSQQNYTFWKPPPPRSRNNVNNDRSVQCAAILKFFESIYNPFNFKYNFHFGLIVSVIIYHLLVACFCVIHCIFNQVLANTLKLCQKNCTK